MEKEKLRWEKDFSHNWSILKNVNMNILSMSIDSNNNGIKEGEKEDLSPINEAISNIRGITSPIEDLVSYKEELTNRTKLTNNLSYNFNYFRNLILVIDLTEKMNMNDYKPTRHKFLFKKLEYLITNFFKYNLISTITIITIKNYLATISSPYSNDPALIIENLRKESEPEGFPSIYNALTVSADYISILDKMNIDIVFFYSSQNSLDRGNIYDLIEFYSENKTEIHFFTFETPFELLYTIIKNTGGVLCHSKNTDDIDIFMNYIIFKKAHKIKNLYKIQYPKMIQTKSHESLCWCHNKLNNSYYQCSECLNVFCKLPALCKFCTSILLNDLSLHQLTNFNKQDWDTHTLETQEENDYISVTSLYNSFFHDKKIILNKKIFEIDLDEFYKFWAEFTQAIKNTHKKEFIKGLQQEEKSKNNIFLQVKYMLLRIKFLLENKVYANMARVLIFDKNIDEFAIKTGIFYIKETLSCIGCEHGIETSKLKSITNYDNFYVCTMCNEILCLNCIQYLKFNHLGCSNC